jgi:hypothetical protein
MDAASQPIKRVVVVDAAADLAHLAIINTESRLNNSFDG